MAEDDGAPWYETFFGEDYLRLYAPVLSPERTAQEVGGIIRLLGLPAGSKILDLCCGHGRHAIALAEQGYDVTGLDLSEVFLQRAAYEALERDVAARWVHGDMRDIPFENEFDAVINIFTAFGYFEDEVENQRVLEQVRKALKPSGRFLLETMARDALVRDYQPFGVQRHDDGLIVIEERRFDQLAGRNHVRITLFHSDGRRVEHSHAVRIYALTELAQMCAAAGLTPEAHYGGLDGSRLTLSSRRLVLTCVAQK